MKNLYNTREVINESFNVVFPKKTTNISFKKKVDYAEDTKEKLVQLECGVAAVQDMVAANPNIAVGNSHLDAILDRLYSLIREVEMIKQNGR